MLAARRLDASQYVEHRSEAAQAPMLPVHPTLRAAVAIELPDISLGLKPRGKPPKLALYHSLDTRRIIKRRLKRRQAQHMQDLQQEAKLKAMRSQLSTLVAEQDYLAMRVRQELAACRAVAAQLAKLTSMLEQNQVPQCIQDPLPTLSSCKAPF